MFAIVRNVEKCRGMQQRGNYMLVHVIIFRHSRFCSPPGPHFNVPVAPKTAKSEKKTQVQNSSATKAKDIVIPPKILPQLKWTPVPCVITKIEAEERIFIREFALRFGHIMGPIISKSSLEELEFIAGKTKTNDKDEMVAWVSEPCLKGLVLGLLGLLAKDHGSEVAKVTNFHYLGHMTLIM